MPVRMRPSVRSILRVSPSRRRAMTPPAAASGEKREIQIPLASLGGSPSVRIEILSSIPLSRRACARRSRSEEHTSELQSRQYLVCRLLLEKKKHIHSRLKYTT